VRVLSAGHLSRPSAGRDVDRLLPLGLGYVLFDRAAKDLGRRDVLAPAGGRAVVGLSLS